MPLFDQWWVRVSGQSGVYSSRIAHAAVRKFLLEVESRVTAAEIAEGKKGNGSAHKMALHRIKSQLGINTDNESE